MKVNTGLIFLSMVTAEDATVFSNLSALANIQTTILSADANIGLDSTSISIFSANSGDEDSDGDFIGSSFLAMATVDESGMYNNRIYQIFDTLLGKDSNNVVIKEVTVGNFFICVRPGAEITRSDRDKIVSIVKTYSTNFEVKYAIDSAIVELNIVDEGVDTIPETKNPVAYKVMETSTIPIQSVESLSEETINAIAERAAKIVLETLSKTSSEVGDKVLAIENNREGLEERMVASILEKVNKQLPSMEVMPIIEDNPDSNKTIKLTGTIENEIIKELTKENNVIEESNIQTNIYDNKITLKSLMDGCESDDMLLDRAIDNIDKLSIDERESLSTFNMYKNLSEGITEKYSPREKYVREIRLGLK